MVTKGKKNKPELAKRNKALPQEVQEANSYAKGYDEGFAAAKIMHDNLTHSRDTMDKIIQSEFGDTIPRELGAFKPKFKYEEDKFKVGPILEAFSTGAVRRKVETTSRTDLIPLEALLALGERYHYGATVRGYGERNWEKGIPYSNLLQHMQVHFAELSPAL